MSNKNATKRISLWREALESLTSDIKMWWPWIFGFIVVSVIMALIFGTSTDYERLAKDMPSESGRSMQLQAMDAMVGSGLKSFTHFAFSELMLCVLYYGISVAFLRKIVKTNPPSYSVGGFFSWLWVMIKKYFFTFLPFLLLALLVPVALFVGPMLGALSQVVPIIGGILAVCCLVIATRTSLLYTAVTPLNLLKHNPALKISSNLTRGRLLRIFGNMLVLSIIVFVGVLFVIGLPSMFLVNVLEESTMTFRVVSGVFAGLQAGISAIVCAIYSCTTYRVLLQEQRAAGQGQPATAPDAS